MMIFQLGLVIFFKIHLKTGILQYKLLISAPILLKFSPGICFDPQRRLLWLKIDNSKKHFYRFSYKAENLTCPGRWVNMHGLSSNFGHQLIFAYRIDHQMFRLFRETSCKTDLTFVPPIPVWKIICSEKKFRKKTKPC